MVTKGQSDQFEDGLGDVYAELRQIARRFLSRERLDHTLQPTALVHEAYIRLIGEADPGWDGGGHFFASAAEAMRRILVEDARRKARVKHGGDRQRVDLDPADLAVDQPSTRLLALDAALKRLEAKHPAKADLVKLRHFAGLTLQQAAQALGISRSTADRNWAYARAWLYDDMTRGDTRAPNAPKS